MPRREDLKHILVIGSGPIVIGQACEFDYSGTQACKILKNEGVTVSLINSNPATIMTDPQIADHTYIEPITAEFIEKIFIKHINEGEKIDAVLATLGGQTALNAAVDLHNKGILEKYDVELIGADFSAISRGEDRQTFKDIVSKIGGESAKSKVCFTIQECLETVEELKYPVVVRPSFTMGGLGSGLAYNESDLIQIATAGLSASPTANVLIEESILGWKEFELELMRDKADNVIVVCSIENIDPVGVHTGDSITVAPAMTLTDRDFQRMRDLSIEILKEVGVETGGCNIQFAQDPKDGRIVVIEMNPRVSRSSALASKATGFPIAKIAAKLALGYILPEILNDITKKTPACFEPTLDYVVVKAPRFAFEKFPSADKTLTTTMKSVGESMSIGRDFREAFGKVIRSLEIKNTNIDPKLNLDEILDSIKIPTPERIFLILRAFELGATVEQIHNSTKIDPWFITEIESFIKIELSLTNNITKEDLHKAKQAGLSDIVIGKKIGMTEKEIRDLRHSHNIRPVFKTVDTCAGEFPAHTPYHYSTYELDSSSETELVNSGKKKIIILGSGPNRIGQGIEFDYSCVHAAQILAEKGWESILINCNPETVSTDYDTASKLYFEPLSLEDVIEICHAESKDGNLEGIIVQLGGQTPLSLAQRLQDEGFNILGTKPNAIHKAEDRKEFSMILEDLKLFSPPSGTAFNFEEADLIAERIKYPILVRPSYVLGGRGMEIIYDQENLKKYIHKSGDLINEHPLLIDKFLENAIEVDVDGLCDGKQVYIAGIMEHIEAAGIHSGDSCCLIPPISLDDNIINKIVSATEKLALALDVKGLINIQFAVKDNNIYVLEANPRASRTVPFVAKATGVSVARACTLIMVGNSIKDLIAEKVLLTQDARNIKVPDYYYVKEAVLPFKRFATKDGRAVESLLGPEMKSTGEVMGVDQTFPLAFAKSQIAAYGSVPIQGSVFISINDEDKPHILECAKKFHDLGFKIYATEGTSKFLQSNGIKTIKVAKQSDTNSDKKIVDLINEGEIDLVINTPSADQNPTRDGYEIRECASRKDIPCITTTQAALAMAEATSALKTNILNVQSIQEIHRKHKQ